MNPVPDGAVGISVKRVRGRPTKTVSQPKTVNFNPPPKAKETEPEPEPRPAAPQSQSTRSQPFPSSIQEKIKSFLETEIVRKEDEFLQFWKPARDTSGHTLLTLSAPDRSMGLRGVCSGGLFSYRCHSLHNDYRVVEGDGSLLGPFGRAFRQGSPEYCPNIECYSIQEFPPRDFAIACGIKQYWVLPLYEIDGHQLLLQQQQKCFGILEYISCRSCATSESLIPFEKILDALKLIGLACPASDLKNVYDSRINSLVSHPQLDIMVKFVKRKHHLPLIRVWAPCMFSGSEAVGRGGESLCNPSNSASKTTKLFPLLVSVNWNMRYAPELYHMSSNAACLVEEGKSLLGKAYSLQKSCFLIDTRKFDISSYPIVHLTRSSGLAASFAIPLTVIHRDLPPLILEIFLQVQQKCEGNLETILKLLLSTVAKELSVHNVDYGLRQNEEFYVKISHLDADNVVYFDVHRRLEVLQREEKEFPSSHQPPISRVDVSDNENHVVIARKKASALIDCPITQDITKYFGKFSPRSNVGIISDNENSGPADCLTTQDKGKSLGNLPADAKIIITLDDENPAVTDCSKAHVKADKVSNFSLSTNQSITLDDLITKSGEKLELTATELGVTRPSLKRICRELGTYWWPLVKKNKVDHIQSSLKIPSTTFEPDGAEIIKQFGIRHCSSDKAREEDASVADSVPSDTTDKSIVPENEETDCGYPMIVKATYGDDIVKFPIRSNLGLQGLLKELDERFKSKGERFKIKYEDDGDWITIACNKDLLFHMDTLRSSEETVMNLSVFPSTS
ncbi:OLC1v1011315C1 [Oldenlandia corymbosa var. corymbosa]|uniref:OLC1v1011315C1 n=1 Tax=Oldenlandia corymbosa var. corymbosa TaxID=529605 RepID=A0AAV1DWK1_OLDCO|nr:OLC1v1011315C1 [Oldenlandia corymbosa var. corymbosa]